MRSDNFTRGDWDPPVIGGVTMGYGHLRAAMALTERLGVPMRQLDRAPFAGPVDGRVWSAFRRAYEALSRASQGGFGNRVFARMLDRVTALGTDGAPNRPTPAVRLLAGMIHLGFGARIPAHPEVRSQGLVSTFYAPALAAHRKIVGPVWCVVTDTDVNRIWAPRVAATSRIRYLVPAAAAVRRLVSFGVDPSMIETTGFPLPEALVGGGEKTHLRRNLMRRLHTLDVSGNAVGPTERRQLGREESPSAMRQPLSIVFAVGGAGAHVERGLHLVRALGGDLESGRLKLTLMAGTRRDVADRFLGGIRALGFRLPDGAVTMSVERTFEAAYRAMNRSLAGADLLWTKPSEMVFYAALGLPLILDPPVGDHERANRAWVLEAGAGFGGVEPERASRWIRDRHSDGSLARAAWSGHQNLESGGTEAIINRLRSDLTTI